MNKTTTVILCRGRAEHCGFCGSRSFRLCDSLVLRNGKLATCDKKICDRCAGSVERDVDLCPPHFRAYEKNGNSFGRFVTYQSGPDERGVRTFTIEWLVRDTHYAEGSVARGETEVKVGDRIVGYARGQVFRAKPEEILRPGDVEGEPFWRRARV